MRKGAKTRIKLDSFVAQFNKERPHEALEMKRPANVYVPSNRRFPEELEPLEYPLHDVTKVVRHEGHVQVRNDAVVYVSTSLAGERLGLRQLSAETWLVTFMDLDLGYIDTSTKGGPLHRRSRSRPRRSFSRCERRHAGRSRLINAQRRLRRS